MNRSFLLFSPPVAVESGTLSLLWGTAFTFGVRLPIRGRINPLEVLVLEPRICRDDNGSTPYGALFFRESNRLGFFESTEGNQAATDVYTLCGKHQGEVRGIYEDLPPSFVWANTSNVSTDVPSASVPRTGGTTQPSARAIGTSFAVYSSTEPCE